MVLHDANSTLNYNFRTILAEMLPVLSIWSLVERFIMSVHLVRPVSGQPDRPSGLWSAILSSRAAFYFFKTFFFWWGQLGPCRLSFITHSPPLKAPGQKAGQYKSDSPPVSLNQPPFAHLFLSTDCLFSPLIWSLRSPVKVLSHQLLRQNTARDRSVFLIYFVLVSVRLETKRTPGLSRRHLTSDLGQRGLFGGN